MGFLDNTTITVDAVLTKKGREYLASNSSKFKITKFALADDGVDYNLYDLDHLSGSSYYGEHIENMPNLEAIPDESQTMKYKLITLPKGTPKIPSIKAGRDSIDVSSGEIVILEPTTLNASAGYDNSTYGYTLILDNSLLFDVHVIRKAKGGVDTSSLEAQYFSNSDTISIIKVGSEFSLDAKDVTGLTESQKTGKIIIVGNETGGLVEIPVTITSTK